MIKNQFKCLQDYMKPIRINMENDKHGDDYNEDKFRPSRGFSCDSINKLLKVQAHRIGQTPKDMTKANHDLSGNE